jgi:alpha-tubulin suppressor-like RCC1 family protein
MTDMLRARMADEQVAAGWRHCAGVTSSGQLYTWGWCGSVGSESAMFPGHSSSGGQLGHGNDFDYWRPTRVEHWETKDDSKSLTGSLKFLHVSCGSNHTAAIVD